jgi:heptosyltransferase-3
MIAIACRKNVQPRVTIARRNQVQAEDLLRSLVPACSGLRVAVHPGSGRSIKCWPYFARLADRLCDRLGAQVVFFGAADEVTLVGNILEQMEFAAQATSVAGELSVGQLLPALAEFDLYVGNDSGPTHLAASLGLPTLCICSGTNDPLQWAPLGPAALTIQRRVSCSPCYLRDREDCPYGIACLEELSVDEVWGAVLSLIPAESANASPGASLSDLKDPIAGLRR